MPRKIKVTAKDIQKSRAGWYQFHYEKRAKFKSMQPGEQHIYENASRLISPPQMTIYGGLPESYPCQEEIRVLVHVQGMRDIDLACHWYTSEEGWQEFQALWSALPEPVDLYTEGCVQIGEVVPTVHSLGELSPAGRQ